MDIQIINHKSKWLNKVQDLGDTASGTVGFLPRDAYFDYARRNQILVVILGLILFISHRRQRQVQKSSSPETKAG